MKKQVKRLNSNEFQSRLVKKGTQETLKKKLTKVQAKCLMNENLKYSRYERDDIVQALVLNSMCPKAYRHLRGTGPLKRPSVRTCERWLAKYKCRPGFQEESIRILKTVRENTEQKFYEESVLIFDEVDLKKNVIEMELKTQTVYGPCKKLQCVMLRGLVLS